jgi:cobalt transporter subunit CbtA
MIGRMVLAALLAGIFAGLVLGLVQHARITPLILAAEKYEVAETHSHDGAAAPHAHEAEEWKPRNGLQRALYTTVASALTGAGFALMLQAASLLSGIPISRQNCLVWGICGFVAVRLAPAAGLPPELPGMPSADLLLRQIWWAGTIIATGVALYIVATRRESWAWLSAAALIALPHVIGAPHAAAEESSVPAGLAAAFAASTLAANAMFWCLIAVALSFMLPRMERAS